MKRQTITLGYSPCPNDTFIFDAMVHHKIDTEGIDFKVTLADVEELNTKAFQEQLHITKLSYHAFAHILHKYQLLNSGSALGQNCGPLLIAKKDITAQIQKNPEDCKIAIPGKYTTANFLLSLAFPKLVNKPEYLFSEIEKAVENDTVDAGLIIHENRFTYQEKGLVKIRDLGEFWEDYSGLPIPLGGIVVKREMDVGLQQKIDRVLHRSVQYAFENPTSSANYVKQHAQEMDEKITQQHIDLYVNKYSLNLGIIGKKAVSKLLDRAVELNIIPPIDMPIFVEN